jgi:hypothetical protein
MKQVLSVFRWFFATQRRAAFTLSVIAVFIGYAIFNPHNARYFIAIGWNNFWYAVGPLINKLLELAFVIGLCYFLWTKVLFKKSSGEAKKK